MTGVDPPPVIDMHLHAYDADAFGPGPVPLCVPLSTHTAPGTSRADAPRAGEPGCPDPIWSPETDDALLDETVEVLERRNIIGVVSGSPERVLRWHTACPDRVMPGIEFRVDDNRWSVASVRKLFAGPFVVLGEILNQYAGIGPGDERMEPYWELAEELDVPVTMHMGEGPPGGPYTVAPAYRARFGRPLLLEDVLVRHPRLRVSVAHYGSPFLDEMVAVMYSHPQVYVDLGGTQWAYPRPYFYGQLARLIDAGFGERIMFGSDQMIWPGVIDHALTIVEEAPFLDEPQKRDILYNNAARFLRFTDEQIARHHGRAGDTSAHP